MIDVVIPVYKPGNELLILLKRLLAQSLSVNRIIIINTGKEYFNDKFLIDKIIEVYHISKSEFDHANTRHMGMEISKADYVLFMTMDAIPADRMLTKNLADMFDRCAVTGEKAAVTYARQLPKKNCRMQECFTRQYNYPDKSIIKTAAEIDNLGIKTYFCSDVCAMYDRNIYFQNGGFEKNMIFNEDMVYAAKAIKKGYAVAYCAEARVYHSHNYSCKEQFARNFDLGVSQTDYKEIFDSVSSESEGVKMVLSTAEYLWENGHWYDIPYLFLNSVSKYVGYKLGRNYHKLSRKTIINFSSNKEYWNKTEE